jgi:phospholipid-binding lipoprotein MlaA
MPSHENDLGITLGVWGVQQGPYLVLPLFGPSTVRDSAGVAYGIMANPLTWYDAPAAATIPLNLVQLMDGRSRAEQEVRFRDQAAIDPYAFTRNAYLQYREGQVHGNAKPKVDQSMYDDPDAAPATQPATRPAEMTK